MEGTEQPMAVEKAESSELVAIRLPVWWTFGGLVAGLLAGLALAGTDALAPVLAVSEPAGTLWLRALQMTIIPLVAALLVMGIAQMVRAARAGRAARRMLGWVFAVLVFSGLVSVVFMPLLLEVFPIPAAASTLLDTGEIAPQQVPSVAEFVTSLIAPNVIAAAAETTMLPLTIFFALFAVAVARLPETQRDTLLGVFRALANAMLTIIGWVLWIAPLGVFALALGVASRAGGGAFATLVHYILVVSAMGAIVLIAGYLLAWLAGGIGPLRFAKAMIPAQAVGLSTQSSLASLPAMLAVTRRLGVRESTADFVLPLAVAIFRATSPAMNLAVAIYVATLAGVELTPVLLAAGVAVALVISVGSVSLPGSISFVVSIGPIALAMGVPVEPLALLVAVEMLPDIMRTLGNVTMDVAITTATDRHDEESV
jgi:Na+/H+-dicarboxylate symporter